MEDSTGTAPKKRTLACKLDVINASHVALREYAQCDTNNNLLDTMQATWQAGYWVENMQYACFTGRHLAVALGLGLPALLLLGLGIPLLFAFMVWRHRLELDSAPCRRRLDFAYRSYK